MNKLPRKPRRLCNLLVNRVDLVDRGANCTKSDDDGTCIGEGSHVMLIKRDGGEVLFTTKARTTGEILDADAMRKQWWALQDAFSESVHQILASPEVDQAGLLQKTVNEFGHLAKKFLADLPAEKPLQLLEAAAKYSQEYGEPGAIIQCARDLVAERK